MAFEFLNDLCESHLIPSKTSLKRWDAKKLSDLAYLYFMGLRVLLADDDTKQWAKDYCKKAGEPNDFKGWRTNGNDLYVLLHAFDDDDDEWKSVAFEKIHLSSAMVRHWLRNHTKEETHKLFMRLDGMFNISDSAMKSMRRSITDWEDMDRDDRHDIVTKLIQMVHTRAPSNSEILPQLKKLQDIKEAASVGATGAASIATSVGGLGAGFDPDADWRSIYSTKKKKPIVIRQKL
jgi:hypothetical protein